MSSDAREGDAGRVEEGKEEFGETMEVMERQLWSDASKLLFQPGYLKVLKNMAITGQLQQYNIRSVCWRLFLHILPEDQRQWETAAVASRDHYVHLKQKHMMDPHQVTASLDINLSNPLSQNEESPWNQFFQDTELRQLVCQDVVRTFPDVHFFRQDNIQKMMEDILFCYVREHADLGYRQGMHELLAPILFVMHAEMRDVYSDPTLAPGLRVVMDPAFIEHDTYAIFAEVMEMVEPWYNSTGLEADKVKAKQQASNQRKNMTFDPHASKPFESTSTAPSSAIGRKLDVVHNILLKKADEVLYVHLKQLSIPAQTYGIRWIRLLFGREFPLPSVLEVWDALFADGPSLVDYMCVAMLMHIREVLIEGDYAVCMHHLMHFPTVYEVNYLVQRALHLRNPSVFPSPRIWSYHPSRNPHQVQRSPPQPAPTPPSQAPPTQQTSRAKQAGAKAKNALSSATKQLTSGMKRIGGNEGGGGGGGGKGGGGGRGATTPPAEEPSPPPPFPPASSQPTPPTVTVTKERKKARGRVVEVANESKEMKNNPKIRSPSSSSLNQLERLTNRVDDLEAKITYCGSKMDSLLVAMEDEISALAETDLPPEMENTLFLSLAGLKQVRDVLLNKIIFSGTMVDDDDDGIILPSRYQQHQQHTSNGAHPLEMASHAPTSQLSQAPLTEATDVLPSNRTDDQPAETAEFHPLMSSGEVERREVGRGDGEAGRGDGEDWVNLSSSHHPLTLSDS